MRTKNIALIALTIMLSIHIQRIEACTRAVYIGPDNLIVTGRTMDWKEDIMSNLYVFPRGIQRAGYNKGETVTWTSKYGSVIATGYDIGTCDGMNEKGLVASLLFLPESVYKRLGDKRPVMGISIWTQYVLDNFATVDEAVNKYSHGALEHVTLYSLFQDPMTSCGCFECICGVEPVTMGVVITCREHAGMTPLGMTFSEMASMTGGGVQTPGFMGHGKHFIASHKFIAAEGGPGRIVWLPKILKDQMRERLDKTALEMYGVENFTDMIADETICTEDPEELLNYLTEVGHPVLSMEPFDM